MFPECGKTYGSDISLNLHIKLKHNGGTKSQRSHFAVLILFLGLISKQKIIVAKLKGEAPPAIPINLPPGFAEVHLFCNFSSFLEVRTGDTQEEVQMATSYQAEPIGVP